RQVARIRPGEDGERALRGRPRAASRQSRRARQCPASRRHPDRARSAPAAGRLRVPPGAKSGGEVQDRRGRGGNLRCPGDPARGGGEGGGGLYLEDCHIAAVNDAPGALDGVKSYALDAGNAERLWEVSETLVGERVALT